jgi:hypothetical protein
MLIRKEIRSAREAVQAIKLAVFSTKTKTKSLFLV